MDDPRSFGPHAGNNQVPRRTHRLELTDPAVRAFWRERHLATLTTLLPNGHPHTVPVAPVLDDSEPLLRVLASRSSRKVKNVAASRPRTAWVTVCQVDGRRWSTLHGTAQVVEAPALVARAEQLYAARFRSPRPNPQRVVLLIQITSVIGALR